MSTVLNIWKLRTHPFRRPLDQQGNPLPETALFSSLNPLDDGRLLKLYFNLYNWDKSKIVHGISGNNVFDQFPDETILNSTKGVLILISGEDAAGRESLQNLILHKISIENQNKKPVIVRATLDGFSQDSNVKSIARSFIRQYLREGFTNPDKAELTELYKAETKEKSSGTSSLYANLFFEFYESIKDDCDRPLVLLVSGGDHYDTWETVYNSTRLLFKYIVVVTNQEKYAESCVNHLSIERAAVIKAQRLDINLTRLYLNARLSAERTASLDPRYPLAPFGDEALNALFAPGSQPDPRRSVRLTIGRLNKILSRAIDLHLDELPKIAQQNNKTADQLNLDETLISQNTITTAIGEL
jgi:hypothetical protein